MIPLLYQLSYPTLLKNYSHSRAPFFHSYKKPSVSNNKKIAIDQKPVKPIVLKVIDHGNKKLISRSNIINNIATK